MMRLRPLILLLACLAGGTSYAAPGEAVDAASGTVRLLLSAEPPSLDSVRATDQVSFFVLSHLMDGLLQYDADNRLAPALAERWELRPDGAGAALSQPADTALSLSALSNQTRRNTTSQTPCPRRRPRVSNLVCGR